MRNILVMLILFGLGQHFYEQYQQNLPTNHPVAEIKTDQIALFESPSDVQYKCDGRTHCSQMKSCEEATFFLQNCPGTKMDGNGDGVPCERQWCK